MSLWNGCRGIPDRVVPGKPHRVVLYTLAVNDMKFSSIAGFTTGEQRLAHACNAFDVLDAEGAGTPARFSR